MSVSLHLLLIAAYFRLSAAVENVSDDVFELSKIIEECIFDLESAREHDFQDKEINLKGV